MTRLRKREEIERLTDQELETALLRAETEIRKASRGGTTRTGYTREYSYNIGNLKREIAKRNYKKVFS